MSIDGLWTVEIGAPLGVVPGGVMMFDAGRLFGGDGRYYYVGSYRIDQDQLNATAKVTHYQDVPDALFGEAEELPIELFGSVAETEMDLSGHVVNEPGTALTMRLTKRAPL